MIEFRVDQKVQNWRKNGKHLPPFMRDFHDQKDLFKSIRDIYEPLQEPYEINWVTAQIYTIDRFLWFMAAHGYTLQKNRSKLDFNWIEHTIKMTREQELDSLKHILGPVLGGKENGKP